MFAMFFFFLLLFVGLGMRAALDPSIMDGVQKKFKEPVRELTLKPPVFLFFFLVGSFRKPANFLNLFKNP